jgi:hypothetical protein
MEEEERSVVWAAFEGVAPNLCYINRTREALVELLDAAGGVGELLAALDGTMRQADNPSFRTDLKILIERLRSKRSSLEG